MDKYWHYILPIIGLSGLGGVLVLWLRNKIILWSSREQAQLKDEQTPLEVLRLALAKRDEEVSRTQAQLYSFMNNHLAHDKEEREALAKVLAGIQEEQRANVETLKEINLEIRGHREEEARRTAGLHTKLDAIHLDVVKE